MRGPGQRLLPATLATAALLAMAALALAAPGDPDPSFDGDGRLAVDWGGSDRALDVLVQPDGKLVTAGRGEPGMGTMVVTRRSADGTEDAGFGNQVIDFVGTFDEADALALQPDGRLVVAGVTSGVPGGDVAVARLRSWGGLDTTFAPGMGAGDLDAADGRLRLDRGGAEAALDAVVLPDGRIVLAGQGGPGQPSFMAMRLSADGFFDFGFGAPLIPFSAASSSARALARQPDGKLVLAGTTAGGGASNMAVARLGADGQLDPTFSPGGGDGDGRREVFLGGSGAAEDVLVQPDGKIVLVGTGYPSGDVVVVRLNEDGSDDPTFDGDGVARIDLGAFDSGTAAVLQANGKIAVAAGSGDPLVMRLQPGGALDSTFRGDGKAPAGFGATAQFFGLALQPDGRLVAAGTVDTNGGDAALARFEGDPPAAGGGPGGGPGGAGGGAPPRCGGTPATIVGTAGKDRLRGTRRADVIAALGGADTVAGGGGADLICGGGGNDRLSGGPGRDRLLGGPGADRLAGGPGADRLLGQAGRDTLLGGAGRDRCLGGPARDRSACERGS
jgi:uncharacterized delta-60 repeat protein